MLSEDTGQTLLEKMQRERERERALRLCLCVCVYTQKSVRMKGHFSEYSFIYSQIMQLLYFFAEDVTVIGPTVQAACSV